ncbi:methyl-accepting chemotaxis protein [Photobacterium sp. OFAV2-7]|uniref:methyl-accepting chemotaxis protein n=1 Tax=Photobacterium sp. OFAV2-7 TaxID=2917748 RepID=UPI001EF4BDD2|nr:methyl-accepting chemotaxis protein [Photobacterium sp. OFAV2-7]MCG7587695.1 methyl-accepting chemotaxis protein [Photobacterium sp. OFAV2-7]
MLALLWTLLVISLGLASWYQTWTEAILIGVPAVLVPTVLVYKLPGTLVSRLSIAISLMVFSALQIHQGHGLVELHFGIFVLLAILSYYRDWRPLVIAATFVAVHHLVGNYLQSSGAGFYVFPEPSIMMVFTHAAFVVVETVALVYQALGAHKDAIQAEEVSAIAVNLMQEQDAASIDELNKQTHSRFGQQFSDFMSAVMIVMKQAEQISQQLHEAAGQLKNNSHNSVESTRRQSTEIDQIATAITEMTVSTHDVSQNAAAAANATTQASQDAQQGQDIIKQSIEVVSDIANEMGRVTDVIREVESSSERIGAIIDVINGIADQTNLLALNAAIEAARAGDQGRGFAVVADEVRSLAVKTQASTDEIQAMIEQLQTGSANAVVEIQKSYAKSQESVKHANEAEAALTNITTAIATISDMNTQIATAAEQQSSVSEDIDRNVTSINELAKDANERADQLLSATDQITRLANVLNETVQQFQRREKH